MRIPDQALQIVKTFEGCRLEVYSDPVGLKTIGYGHLIKQDEQFTTITESQATDLLISDLQIAAGGVSRLITSPINQNQLSALLDFSFNLGNGALQHSTLRMKLNRKQYNQAAGQFLIWIYAGGIKLPGLILRRHAEQKLFLS